MLVNLHVNFEVNSCCDWDFILENFKNHPEKHWNLESKFGWELCLGSMHDARLLR